MSDIPETSNTMLYLVIGFIFLLLVVGGVIYWFIFKNKCGDCYGEGGDCLEGVCVCKTGYTGDDCSNKIPICGDKFCMNGGTCDITTEECDCVDGWSGAQCDHKDCEPTCLNNMACDTTKGKCILEAPICNTEIWSSKIATKDSADIIRFEMNKDCTFGKVYALNDVGEINIDGISAVVTMQESLFSPWVSDDITGDEIIFDITNKAFGGTEKKLFKQKLNWPICSHIDWVLETNSTNTIKIYMDDNCSYGNIHVLGNIIDFSLESSTKLTFSFKDVTGKGGYVGEQTWTCNDVSSDRLKFTVKHLVDGITYDLDYIPDY